METAEFSQDRVEQLCYDTNTLIAQAAQAVYDGDLHAAKIYLNQASRKREEVRAAGADDMALDQLRKDILGKRSRYRRALEARKAARAKAKNNASKALTAGAASSPSLPSGTVSEKTDEDNALPAATVVDGKPWPLAALRSHNCELRSLVMSNSVALPKDVWNIVVQYAVLPDRRPTRCLFERRICMTSAYMRVCVSKVRVYALSETRLEVRGPDLSLLESHRLQPRLPRFSNILVHEDELYVCCFRGVMHVLSLSGQVRRRFAVYDAAKLHGRDYFGGFTISETGRLFAGIHLRADEQQQQLERSFIVERTLTGAFVTSWDIGCKEHGLDGVETLRLPGGMFVLHDELYVRFEHAIVVYDLEGKYHRHVGSRQVKDRYPRRYSQEITHKGRGRPCTDVLDNLELRFSPYVLAYIGDDVLCTITASKLLLLTKDLSVLSASGRMQPRDVVAGVVSGTLIVAHGPGEYGAALGLWELD